MRSDFLDRVSGVGWWWGRFKSISCSYVIIRLYLSFSLWGMKFWVGEGTWLDRSWNGVFPGTLCGPALRNGPASGWAVQALKCSWCFLVDVN